MERKTQVNDSIFASTNIKSKDTSRERKYMFVLQQSEPVVL